MFGEVFFIYNNSIDNAYNQLCLPETNPKKCISDPQLIKFNMEISQISCGENHILILSCIFYIFIIKIANGTAYFSGNYSKTHFSCPDPIILKNLLSMKISQIACGWTFSLFLETNGNVFSNGQNKFGALGLGAAIGVLQMCENPTKMEYFEKSNIKITHISAGSNHSAFIDENKIVYMCGLNKSGQLGIGSKNNQFEPVKIIFTEKVKKIACGVVHNLIVSENDELFSMGANNMGQLGLGDKISHDLPKKIETLKNIKNCWCGHQSAALANDGKFYIWGTGSFGEILTPKEIMNDVNMAEIGSCFGILKTNKGQIFSYGTNTSGELGIGTFESKNEPILIKTLCDKNISKISCGPDFAVAILEKSDKINPQKDEKIQETLKNTNEISEYIKSPILSSPDLEKELIETKNMPKLQSSPQQNKKTGIIRRLKNSKDCENNGLNKKITILTQSSLEPNNFKEIISPINENQNNLTRKYSFEETLSPTKKDELKLYKEQLEEVRVEISELKNSVTFSKDSTQKKGRLDFYISENYELKKKITELEGKLRENNIEMKNIIDDVNNTKNENNKIKDELSQKYLSESELNKKLLSQISLLEQEKQKLNETLIEKTQIISENIERHKNTILKLTTEKTEFLQNQEKSLGEIQNLKQSLENSIKTIENLKNENSDLKKQAEMLKNQNQENKIKIDELLKEKLKLSADLERVLIENSTFLTVLEQHETDKNIIKISREVQTIAYYPSETKIISPMRIIKPENYKNNKIIRGMSAYTPSNRENKKPDHTKILDEKLSQAMQKYKGLKNSPVFVKKPINQAAKRYKTEEEKSERGNSSRNTNNLTEQVRETKNKLTELRKSQENLHDKIKNFQQKVN